MYKIYESKIIFCNNKRTINKEKNKAERIPVIRLLYL